MAWGHAAWLGAVLLLAACLPLPLARSAVLDVNAPDLGGGTINVCTSEYSPSERGWRHGEAAPPHPRPLPLSPLHPRQHPVLLPARSRVLPGPRPRAVQRVRDRGVPPRAAAAGVGAGAGEPDVHGLGGDDGVAGRGGRRVRPGGGGGGHRRGLHAAGNHLHLPDAQVGAAAQPAAQAAGSVVEGGRRAGPRVAPPQALPHPCRQCRTRAAPAATASWCRPRSPAWTPGPSWTHSPGSCGW